MDSITQALLGAAVGEAVAGRKAGNKAVIWGAVAGTIPDLDVLGGYFLNTVDAIDFHRSITHSLVFAVFLSPLLGYAINRIHRTEAATWRDWTLLAFLGLFTHALLDCFTTWGTQLFWPFSDYRVALKSIFVIDPLYTVPLLISVVWLFFLDKRSKKRRIVNTTGLCISSLYLILTLVVKQQVNQVFDTSFSLRDMPVIRYESRPSPFNIILWAVNAETERGYFIGYYSLLDEKKEVEYHFFPKNHDLLEPYAGNSRVQQLLCITQGWYTVEGAGDGIILSDLRFGQSTGWEHGTGKFVFAYHIYRKNDRIVIDEVEKNFKDGRKMLEPLWRRILGNENINQKIYSLGSVTISGAFLTGILKIR